MNKKKNTGLIIDTSAGIGNLSLYVDKQVVDSITLDEDISHSNIILDAVKKLIIKNRIDKHQINFIAFCSGPGSYTGIRIGAAIALGLAKAFKCICIGISKFQALSTLIEDSDPHKIIIDGGLGSIYIKEISPDLNTDKPSIIKINIKELDEEIFNNCNSYVIQESSATKELKDIVSSVKKELRIKYASDNVNHYISLYLSDLDLREYKYSQTGLTPLYL
jgi:tRNA threonylcarbamoyl adenosine modification protein YeaZ